MRDTGRSIAVMVLVCVAGMFVGFGTCALGGKLPGNSAFLTIGIVIFVLSFCGLVISAICGVIFVLVKGIRRL